MPGATDSRQWQFALHAVKALLAPFPVLGRASFLARYGMALFSWSCMCTYPCLGSPSGWPLGDHVGPHFTRALQPLVNAVKRAPGPLGHTPHPQEHQERADRYVQGDGCVEIVQKAVGVSRADEMAGCVVRGKAGA
eukprot:scaffold1891_cov362-Prasinococcus_capsulatus_cf.AAC.1